MIQYSGGGKRLGRKQDCAKRPAVRIAAAVMCLSILAGLLPALALAEDAAEKLSSVVTFESITLHYAGADGQSAGAEVQGSDLLGEDDKLVLRYKYHIEADKIEQIAASTPYYLDVSAHLKLPNLMPNGSSLTIDLGDGTSEQFGTLYADGASAWVTFEDLSAYEGISNAYFYLNCGRAGDPPSGEIPIEGHSNLYAMKFENGGQLHFGYAENEPVTAKAQISKDGSLTDKAITWEIAYTPWQNPGPNDPVALDTPFELRDTIDTTLHSYVPNSVKINGQPVTAASRDESAEAYVLVETPEDGKTTLTIGGTKFKAGQATQGNPAVPLEITYQTTIKDELLLPGSAGGKSVKNAAELFAGKDGVFNRLGISSSKTVAIPQPAWVAKEGHTTRHTDGTGSTTDWTVTFAPNGFTFTDTNSLTLHDQLPQGSTLVGDAVKITVNGTEETKTAAKNETENSFTVPGITTTNQPVTIKYQTHVPEEMYDSGTSLGSNIAWFTFQYDGRDYTTPQAKKDVGSGDGSGQPGTSTLVKTNTGYNAATRTISWTVKINPHKAYLKSGTFTDDLKTGAPCGEEGHGYGLELVGAVQISLAGAKTDTSLVTASYDSSSQNITVEVGNVGATTVTLTYTTKVCDPCIFANNTAKTMFNNTISTENMIIGSQSATGRSASADSTAEVSAAVLTKKAPVYDYATGLMKWTVEVDAAGLSMADVVLTDELPAGLTYVEDSLKTFPAIADAMVNISDRKKMNIHLPSVAGKTTVTFDTKVDPEILGFGGDQPVVVENTIRMNGSADGVTFAEVSHRVEQSFSNHGLVKSSSVNNVQELIQYEVLINPYHLALPENPSLVDTLDKRLQLDTDTLMFCKAALTGTTAASGQKPGYVKQGESQRLKVTGFDPATNSFTVELPIDAGNRDAYVLAYTADIIDHQAGGYGNSVRFDGGSVLLGGGKNNSASVGGGGGGGGGGVAARKATIAIVKTDSETKAPLPGVTFTLCQWDGDTRGLPFAQGTTDAQGKLSFRVKPGADYELVETASAPGYGSVFALANSPSGVTKTENGLRITAGAAKSTLTLELTNEAHTTDIVFRLVNESGIPMAGSKVRIFTSDPTGQTDPVPAREFTVSADGVVRFSSMRRGARYYIQRPGGGIMTVDVPAEENEPAKAVLPDGTQETLTEDYQAEGVTPSEEQWTLSVKKVVSGGETPLAGAEIGLYADEDCAVLIQTAVSGEDGNITFSGLIEGQSYWLKEIEAPSGFDLNTKSYKTDKETPEVTIENTPSPAPPAVPARPHKPNKPTEPEIPEEPETPVEPETPEEPETPVEPEFPEEPETPVEPEFPEEPETPAEAETPAEPDIPEQPNTPGWPDVPGGSDFFGGSDNSGGSGMPNGTDASGEGGTTGQRGSGTARPDTESSASDSGIPQTGDDVKLPSMIVLLSGVMLAAVFALKSRKKS